MPPKGLAFRAVEPADFDDLVTRIDDWWGGRSIHTLLPRLFFEHFRDTSFIAEVDGRTVGFLIGFLAQSEPDEAYIHFVGVDPGHRRDGIGRALYERFFEVARANRRRIVRCVTSPVNKGSVAYHTAMGFSIEPGDGVVDGLPVHLDHDGPGEHRVRFIRDVDLRRSAVVVPVPLPAALEAIRLASDPVAAHGVPAHVTILFPFLEPRRLDEAAIAGLREVLGREAAFELVLATVETFGPGIDEPAGVVYLAPESPEPFRRLTAAVWAAFPDHPPYGGRFDEVVPHLTIATDTARLAEVRQVAATALPLRRRVSEAWLIVEGEDGRWTRRARLALAPSTAGPVPGGP